MIAVILAAGAATRFGATKQLAGLDGRPLIAHVVGAARAAVTVDEVVVVVGYDGDAVAAAARTADPDVRIAVNRHHARGQATSLRVGIETAAPVADVAVVLLADEPDVASSAIDAVAAAVAGGAVAARARYDDAPGHPVAFAAAVFDRLRQVEGDRGARDLMAVLDVAEVAVPGPRPRDLDRPQDLAERARR